MNVDDSLKKISGMTLNQQVEFLAKQLTLVLPSTSGFMSFLTKIDDLLYPVNDALSAVKPSMFETLQKSLSSGFSKVKNIVKQADDLMFPVHDGLSPLQPTMLQTLQQSLVELSVKFNESIKKTFKSISSGISKTIKGMKALGSFIGGFSDYLFNLGMGLGQFFVKIAEEYIPCGFAVLKNEYELLSSTVSGYMKQLYTGIASALYPYVLKLIQRLNELLSINKELIQKGLSKLVELIESAIRAFFNVVETITLMIDSSANFNDVLLILAGTIAIVAALFKSAFLMNPFTWIVLAIAGVIALLDDLFVYMRGGKSLLGDSWKPFIDGILFAKDEFNKFSQAFQNWWANNGDTVIAVLTYIWEYVSLVLSNIFNIFSSVLAALYNSFKMLFGLFTGDMALFEEGWFGFWDGLSGVVLGIFSLIMNAANKMVSGIKSVFSSVKRFFGLGDSDEETQIDNLVPASLVETAESISGLPNAVSSASSQAASSLNNSSTQTNSVVNNNNKIEMNISSDNPEYIANELKQRLGERDSSTMNNNSCAVYC